MKRIREFLTGWKNLVFGNPEIKQMAKARMDVCSGCQHASETIYLHCSLCGCYIPAKARSPESDCPAGKWPSAFESGT